MGTKPNDYADAYSYNQHLGYAFYMDVVIDSNQNILIFIVMLMMPVRLPLVMTQL